MKNNTIESKIYTDGSKMENWVGIAGAVSIFTAKMYHSKLQLKNSLKNESQLIR